MTISETDQVDFATLEPDTNKFVLSISDHLEWTDEPHEHLLLLQEKLNTYLRFAESGEIYRELPSAIGRKIVFRVVGKYPLSIAAKQFFDRAREIVGAAGFELSFYHLEVERP